MREPSSIHREVEKAFAQIGEVVEGHAPAFGVRETGVVRSIAEGIAQVEGLPDIQTEELMRFPGNRLGMAFNLDPETVGTVLLDPDEGIESGTRVARTGRVLDVPVGDALAGRVVDPLGRPRDGYGAVGTAERRPLECEAPPIMNRTSVREPLQTGLKTVDALVPVGRGQRELILGDRQTGKTAIAIASIINQRDYNVRCVYCAIAQRSTAVAKVVADLRAYGAMDYTTVVVTTGDEPAGLQYAAPYAATSMAEYFADRGEDVLIVYDDLTRHARAYREMSLLLRRPPGREAYPGDIFYIHSRLLERSARLDDEHGGGSLTALPIIETQAQNISAYIPTNLISITDGQLYLSPKIFQQGVLPAIDVGRSVSRVGGNAQLPAYRSVAGNLKLTYAQFEELERFSRYGARLEEGKRKTLERGRRVREVLKQGAFEVIRPGLQIAVLLAVTEGVLDDVPAGRVAEAQDAIFERADAECGGILRAMEEGKDLGDEQRDRLLAAAREAAGPFREESGDGNA